MLEKTVRFFSPETFDAAAVARRIYDYVRMNGRAGFPVEMSIGVSLLDAPGPALWMPTITTELSGHPESISTVMFTADDTDRLTAAIEALAESACECTACRQFFAAMCELPSVASTARDFTLRGLSLEQAAAEGEADTDAEQWIVGVYRTRTVEYAPKKYRVEGERLTPAELSDLGLPVNALFKSSSQAEAMRHLTNVQHWLDAHPAQGPLGTGTTRLSARMFAGELPATFGKPH